MHYVDPDRTTLAEWLWTWLDVYKLPALKESTKQEYISHMNFLTRQPVAAQPVSVINRMECQEVLNDLAAAGYSKSTIRKYRILLRTSFEVLVDDRVLKYNPCEKLFIPAAPTKEVRALTKEEQQMVESACAEDALGHLIVVLLYTGLRKGELMALNWDDYDPVEESVMIRDSKTEAGVRKVYLVSKVVDIIERMPRINRYIFNHTRKKPVTPTVMRRLVDRICERTGIDDFTCHVCRHTFVTRLCEEGVPAKAIAQIIGHARADYVLDIYAQMEADELRKSIYVLETDGKRRSALMGASLNLPVSLYSVLKEEADRQKVSVDALVTFLLSRVVGVA